jgi:hypothetical protein
MIDGWDDMFDAQGWKLPALCPAVSIAYKVVIECDRPVGHPGDHEGQRWGSGPRLRFTHPGHHGCTGTYTPQDMTKRRGRV